MSHLSSEALREFRLPDMPGQRTVRDLSSHCLAIKALQLFSFGYETLNLARFMKYSLFFSPLFSAGCSFGGRFYSLEDTWHPDLGEPFGVMHCVECQCEPVSFSLHPPSPWQPVKLQMNSGVQRPCSKSRIQPRLLRPGH